MVECEVKKVVAVCFLDAVKLVLDQLGRYRMELTSRAAGEAKDLVTIYGNVRRLRDHLQRCLGSTGEVIDLDLDADDQSLLVACARRAVETHDLRAKDPGLGERDKEWLRRKIQVLADWAVHLAEKPLREFPLPRLQAVMSGVSRDLTLRVQAKVFESGEGASASVYRGNDLGQLADVRETTDDEPSATGHLNPGEPSDADMAPPAPSEDAPIGPGYSSMGIAGTRPPQKAKTLFDPRQIKDPRLRALMVLDLRAYDRAKTVKDHRLAAVHLYSILEGAVIDYSMPRRQELGLGGSPDSWNAQEIFLKVMGDACTPKDRSLAYQLFAARNLIRPTAQMVSPTVVTPSSVEALEGLVKRGLHEMGFQAEAVKGHVAGSGPTKRI